MSDDSGPPEAQSGSGFTEKMLGRIVGSVVSRVVDSVDLDEVIDRIDVFRVLDRADVDRLMTRVDVNALVDQVVQVLPARLL